MNKTPVLVVDHASGLTDGWVSVADEVTSRPLPLEISARAIPAAIEHGSDWAAWRATASGAAERDRFVAHVDEAGQALLRGVPVSRHQHPAKWMSSSARAAARLGR